MRCSVSARKRVHAVKYTLLRARSGAPLIRDRNKFRIWDGPGSAAHHVAHAAKLVESVQICPRALHAALRPRHAAVCLSAHGDEPGHDVKRVSDWEGWYGPPSPAPDGSSRPRRAAETP